ncbi:Eco57I restriction-modification methylase domain-containing protein [Micromonospora sp. LOL_014]|uniref:Eco57I restriction-modification methylase domain-containing protein n=1 Tax=Micromonospora sp. LOL_014 TaxID=3345415 RepID=UPI003A8BEC72
MSAIARNQVFSAVHTIGGLLPADLLIRISEGRDVSGGKPADYRVVGSRSVRDAAERRWDYLRSVWAELRGRLPVAPPAATPADPTGYAVSQWLEPLLDELGFGRLTPIGASGITADDGGKTFPVSHRWQHVPVHLIGWNADLDKPAAAGGVRAQSMVQECLNRSDAHLWGVLSNGRQLRLLRDSSALATAAYVEFDLEAIFDGELFSEFVLLYRLLHVSRFDVAEGAAPSTCWLERWRTDAISTGVRALDQLRKGVQEAITTLGTGFLRHPDNARLREDLDAQAFHNALLRLVYRLLFLFVAEDRDALHPPGTTDQTRERYARYFSSARLRGHARRRRGTTHSDLYQALRIVLDALGDERGRPELGLPGLGGIFDDRDADAPLREAKLANEHLLAAVRHLSQVRDTGSRRWRTIDYRHLDAEELGSIYESLLELVPKHSAVDRAFELVELAGNTRKTTGSYYTPASLISCLLDSALDPVIDDAVKRAEQAATADGQPDPSDAIVSELLSLTVCDPACGSGHFLVAAARRIAKRVAAVRERNPEPTNDAVRRALHEVIANCIFGVDLNPMAVELAKVSLWLEALEPGKPLSFLDAHIKHGNALIGATPALLRRGIPDAAFKSIEGDDKKYAKALERQNAKEREGQESLFDLSDETKVANTVFANSLRRIISVPANTLRDVHQQESAYREWQASDKYARAQHVADAWCAAFMWKKAPGYPRAITHSVFRALDDPTASAAPQPTHDEINRLREQYGFFHWHLEFPEVFDVPEHGSVDVNSATGWLGGFDCVLGNPPWERISFDDDEFFTDRDPDILQTRTTDARKSAIAAAVAKGAHWAKSYKIEVRNRAELSQFYTSSAQYPLTARGRLNTQALFTSRALDINSNGGRSGLIVPTGVLTDVPMKSFWEFLRDSGFLRGVLDFENSLGIFAGVHRSTKFTLLSLERKRSTEDRDHLLIGVYLRSTEELINPQRIYRLPLGHLSTLNPITKQLPICLTRKDFDILLSMTLAAKDQLPIRPWVGFTSDAFSHYYLEHSEAGTTGLVEGKMVHQFDPRFGDYSRGNIGAISPEEKNHPSTYRHYCKSAIVDEFLHRKGVHAEWTAVARDYVRATDARTAIGAIVPRSAPIQPLNGFSVPGAAGSHAWCLAVINSFAYDFMAKQKTPGQHFNVTIMSQIPVISPIPELLSFVTKRVLELNYITKDLHPFARDLGDNGAPFVWIDERRTIIRAELDALFFILYGATRSEVNYIMDSFLIVKKIDERAHGTYRTKEAIIAEYDRMTAAGTSSTSPFIDGVNYTSTLKPPPGHGPRHTGQKFS